jgi:hypothetical protein
MCERQIFSNPFFESMKNILNTMVDKVPEELEPHNEDSDHVFNFTYRMIFDLAALSTENKYLLDLTKVMLNMLNRNDNQLMKLIETYVLVDKAKLGKDEKSFYESLISNTEVSVRDMNGLIITYSVNRLFGLDNMEMVDTLMN